MAAVKVGVSRQVAIPKALHDKLGLTAGDYLEIELQDGRLILTPKAFVEKRLAEALEDVKQGRMGGPYESVGELIKSLHGKRAQRKSKRSKRTA